MIAESTFGTVFGATVAGGEDSLPHVARAVVRAGYALVVNRPETKKPICTLTSAEVKKADELARAEAYDAGKKRWELATHPCGVHHAITVDKDADRIVKRLVKNHGRINLGIELHRSRLVVVDVDTEEENAAFRNHARELGFPLSGGYTIATPGVMGDDPANWKHKNGGHYWFTLPEGIELPATDGVYKHPSGWTAMWANRQVLVPPSVRSEGAYRSIGEPQPIPQWLLKEILVFCVERKRAREDTERRKAERLASGSQKAAIDVWSTETPWSELLEPDGWYDTTVPDNCGCPIWTAPGVHASTKSATAHDVGCARMNDDTGHAPLHVWTDNPPDFLDPNVNGKTFTKIQYLALRDHDGNVAAACRDAGIAREGGNAAELVGLGANNPELMRAALSPNGSGEVDRDPFPMLNGSSGADGSPLSTPTGEPSSTGSMAEQLPMPEQPPDPTEKAIAEEMWRLHVREEAKTRFQAQRLTSQVIPIALTRGDEFLAIEDEEEQYLLDQLWPRYGNVILAAQRKSGKTTLVGNLLRSLCDGDPFLGRFCVQRPAGTIALVDLEMSEAKLRYWTRKQSIVNSSRFHVDSLRGKVATFDILNDKTRERWAEQFRSTGTEVLIVDCLRPLMDCLGLDENRDAGVVLSALETLLADAGIASGLVVHHAGHDGSRSRGDSRLRDWPDAEWLLARAGDEDNSPRKFSAFGRDVEVPADLLAFDPDTHRLTLPAAQLGFGAQIMHPEVVRELVRVMAPLLGETRSTNALVEALHGIHGKDHVKAALNKNVGRVFERQAGTRQSWQWKLASTYEYYVSQTEAPEEYEGPHGGLEPLQT